MYLSRGKQKVKQLDDRAMYQLGSMFDEVYWQYLLDIAIRRNRFGVLFLLGVILTLKNDGVDKINELEAKK